MEEILDREYMKILEPLLKEKEQLEDEIGKYSNRNYEEEPNELKEYRKDLERLNAEIEAIQQETTNLKELINQNDKNDESIKLHIKRIEDLQQRKKEYEEFLSQEKSKGKTVDGEDTKEVRQIQSDLQKINKELDKARQEIYSEFIYSKNLKGKIDTIFARRNLDKKKIKSQLEPEQEINQEPEQKSKEQQELEQKSEQEPEQHQEPGEKPEQEPEEKSKLWWLKPEQEPKQHPEPGEKPEQEPEEKSKLWWLKPEQGSEQQPAQKPEPKSEPKPESKSAPKPESKPEPKKDTIRIDIGRNVIISFDDEDSRLPDVQSMRVISEDMLKGNAGKLDATEKMYRILATLGNEGTEELEQVIGRNLQPKDFEQNADRLDDTLITALDHLSSISKDGEKGQSVAREAMKLYLADVLNNKKTPGLAIQYDLEDLSKGKFRSFMNKVPFLKKRSPFLTRQQKDYIYDMAAKSAEFTETAKGKYFKHSKLLRRFFKDDGKLALPAPKTQDPRESFMTKLQGYKMAEDPHKHMAQYEIDRLNRIDAERIAREAEAKKDSGRDR